MSDYGTASGRIAFFKNPPGAGYVVATLDSGVTIKFDTEQPNLFRGNSVTALGTWTEHHRYGRQLKCYGYYYNIPEELEENLKPLNESLVFVFQTLDLKIHGGKIVEHYGVRAKQMIENDPYGVAYIKGLGFAVADKIAKKLGIEEYDPRRAQSFVENTLKKASNEGGHVYVPYGPLVERASEELEVDFEFIEESLAKLALPQKGPFDQQLPPRIVIERISDNKRVVYPYKLHVAETSIPDVVHDLLSRPAPPIPFKPEDLKSLKKANGGEILLSEEQQDAVSMSLLNRICLITGGPGVGKTTIVKKIVEIARRNQLSVALCSYTGRAARRLAEAVGEETDEPARTIHKTLAFDPRINEFQANSENPLPYDLVICDEASMIDLWIGHCLLDALSNKTRIVFVGDADQLPPIGPGALFRQLIESEHVPTVRLNKIFRQAEGSLIISGSHQLLRKERPKFGSNPKTDDLFLFTYKRPEDGVATIIDLVTSKIPENFNLHWRDVQILAPVYKGPMGIFAINDALQETLMGCKPGSDVRFSIGDRVMMTENKEIDGNQVMNGEIGYVVRNIPELVIDFNGIQTMYAKEQARDYLILAYAVSIHKSQGSEYPAAIVVLDGRWQPGFFCRNMLYTAMTRGKRAVILLSPAKSTNLVDIIATDEKKRMSRLLERLSPQFHAAKEEEANATA